MKITAVETIGLEEFPNILWVHIHTDEGIVGLGETFYAVAPVAEHIHQTCAPYLLGKNPLEIDRHSRQFLNTYLGFNSVGVEMRAASAVDVALWDLFGQFTGQPIYQLLGGASRDKVRVYNTCAGYQYVRAKPTQGTENFGLPAKADKKNRPYEDLMAFKTDAGELAKSLLEMNITGMKIWPFDPYAEASLGHDISTADLDRALEPFRKIRGAVGTAIDVMVELHALWDVPAACRIASALDEFEPAWIEDPVRVSSPGALADVQRATQSPLAVGETLTGLAPYRDLITRGGAQIIVFDVGWVGGVTEARKVAALAEAFERPVAPHDCTGPVVYTAATHLSMHLPNAIMQESVRAFWSGWYGELVTALPVIENGMVAAPEGPGLGTALRPEVFERADVHIRSTVLS